MDSFFWFCSVNTPLTLFRFFWLSADLSCYSWTLFMVSVFLLYWLDMVS